MKMANAKFNHDDSCNTSSDMNGHVSNIPQFEGYDFSFEPALDSSFECAICLLCQRDPVQTICGHRFCKYCIELWLKNSGKNCPVDNKPLTTEEIFPDNCAKREISLLTIKCPNFSLGCIELISIGKHEDHLQNCTYEEISCPHACNVFMRKKNLSEHIKKSCENRPVQCEFCKQFLPFKDVENHQKTNCPHGKLHCPHCQKELERYQLQRHLDKECSKVLVTCCFNAFGCNETVTRTALLQHIEESKELHDEMICKLVHKLVAKGLESSQPISFRRSSVDSDSIPISPKIQMHLLERREMGASSAFSVPCTSKSKNLEKMSDRTDQYIQELFTRIVGLEQLNQQMQNDMAQMRQKIIEKDEYFEGKFCNGNFKWLLKNFSFLKNEALQGNPRTIHSPSFYTSPCGYRFCLRISFQITKRQQDDPTISIYVHLMQGDYDDDVEWPFRGNISLSIIDKCDPERTITESMMADPQSSAFQRPSINPSALRNIKGFGYREFTSASLIETEKFVQDDSIMVKVKIEPF